MPTKAKLNLATEGKERPNDASSWVQEKDFVDALARGLDVINAFSAEHPEMTLSEVAVRAGITAASARRCLLTLQALGYVGMVGRRFLLRPKVLSLGSAFLNSMNLKDIGDPYLQDLADEFHDSTSLTVLEDQEIVYIAHIASRRPQSHRVRIGSRLPAHASSMGHVLLAYLPPEDLKAFLAHAPFPRFTSFTPATAEELRSRFKAVRANGYATNLNLIEHGSRAVAIPVHDARGQVIAAINCSAESPRVEIDEMVESRLPKLLAAARKIEQALARYPALAHAIGRSF